MLAHIGACLIGAEEPRNIAQRGVLCTLTGEKKPKKKKSKKSLQDAA